MRIQGSLPSPTHADPLPSPLLFGLDETDPARRGFILARLGTGAAGLAALTPYLAVRGGATALDAALAAATATFVLAGSLASRPGSLAPGRAAALAGAVGLGRVALAASGGLAWPVLLLLAAEPLAAQLAGEGRRARRLAGWGAAALVAGLLLLLLASPPGTAPGTAAAASAILALSALAGLAAEKAGGAAKTRSGAPGLAGTAAEALENASDLVTWHDGSGDVLSASAASGRLLGTRPEELVGGGFAERVLVPDRPAFLKALSDAFNGAAPAPVELRLRAGSREDGEPGRVIPVELRVLRIDRGAEGPVVAAVTRDVSGEKRRAEELDRARQEAERANAMKGRFLATVSHELRTPLNAIIGFSELLSVDHPFLLTEERRKEYAGIIRDSGHHLLEIVNTLLDMSKIETGNFHFLPEPFDMGALASGCCDLMQLKAEDAGVRIARVIAPDLPEIMADRRACRQILINLVSNAVKFTPVGGEVTLTLARRADALVLAVSDTGIGIAEADLPRLGDPFFQAGDVHNRQGEGTGLGLSVVRGLVGLHSGTMAIESGSGAGTTVTVTLPVAGTAEPGKPGAVVVHTLFRRPARPAETGIVPERKRA